MREILFRGKRADNDEWVNGHYAKCRGRHYILPLCNENGYDERYEDFIEVIPETVGQYTGLPDKNGKKIFEGDICGCFCNTQIFLVEYCKDRCGYFFDYRVFRPGCNPQPECLGNLQNRIKVLGNIHDNPELLEEEE